MFGGFWFCLFVLSVSVTKRPKVLGILLVGDREENIALSAWGAKRGASTLGGAVMDEQGFEGSLGLARERSRKEAGNTLS